MECLTLATGVILQGKPTLRAANLQNGATVTAHVRQAQLVSSALAFALLRPDGTVVTWGNAIDGGDSSAVQDELKDCCFRSDNDRALMKRVFLFSLDVGVDPSINQYQSGV